MSLFDEQNFAEISHPDYPGERLIACRNPALAELRARKRTELLDATGAALAPIQAAVTAGRLAGADKIGLRVGKVLGRHKMAKHFHLEITDTTLAHHQGPAEHRRRNSSRRHLRAPQHRSPATRWTPPA